MKTLFRLFALLTLIAICPPAHAIDDFVPTGSMTSARYGHTAAMLGNGKVLISGGIISGGYLSSAEIYDPATGTWSSTSSMTSARYQHAAAMLGNGKVLISGGIISGNASSNAEIYNSAPATWYLFTAAESALAVADAGLVNLSPIEQVSVVTGAASHSGSGNAMKLQTVDDGTTYAERTIVGPALVNFWWRVSSEEGADFFSYRIDGTLQQSISGNGSWVNRSLTLGAGTHTLRWTYAKDVDSANFEDAAYLDDLVIQEAYTNLEVSAAGTAITGTSTLDFGTVKQDAAVVTQSLTLKNTGTISQSVTASLPAGGGFVFSTGLRTASLTLSAGQQSTLVLKMPTNVAGHLSALLGITATGSRTTPPAITLSGNVQAKAPNLVCSWSGGTITSGQSTAVDFGVTPSDLTITVSNTGDAVLNLASVSISQTGDFQVISQPSSTVASGGTTTFTIRALDASRGSHQASVTITSDDPNTPNFTFPVNSKSYLVVAGTGFVHGSFTTSGTTLGWDTASTTLASGSSGQALKTGITPDGGNSTIGATFDGPGLLSWNWQVSAQANYDWLVCEVNGVEVAGISVKTAAWQSQVVQIQAGSQVRWIYRKDAAFFAGRDTGYLSDIRFSKFATAQSSFDTWSAARGGLTPTQIIPKGGMQAMFAWLGGVDPTTGPSTGQYQPSVSGGFYKYRYTVAKAAAGIVQPQISTDLVTWDSRLMKQTLISEDDTSAVIELSVAATGKIFSRLAANVPASVYTPVPVGFVYVAAGSFTMGDALDGSADAPTHTVTVSAFYMAKNLVTWAEYQSVQTWAVSNGYTDLALGAGKASTHPVYTVTWWDGIKYCNARSEMEGLTPVYSVSGAVMKTGISAPEVNWTANGYRLPTEAEWEKAARGGLSGKRFPSGDTISQSQANYKAYSGYGYDLSGAVNFYHPVYAMGGYPYTSPVGSFASNDYGLNDMAGNVVQWCWDWYGSYDIASTIDPRGASFGSNRVFRGGRWTDDSFGCRVAARSNVVPSNYDYDFGFRVARSLVP
jgi:formylglycine-generating enzyme required for sulfatase activity